MAFLFGLFHGLGFADGLLDAMSSMPAAAAVAIAAFSTGVEIGHQVVVLPAFGGLCLLRRVPVHAISHDALVQRYGSAVIALVGIVYVVASCKHP
jgi:hypothetical protein